jgi:hypothetical protein
MVVANLFLLICDHNDSIFYNTLYGKYIMPEDGQSRSNIWIIKG